MKSMKQMQEEMLSRCKFDGSYPKPVHVGLGVIALAYTREDELKLLRIAELHMKVMLASAIIGLVFVIVLSVFLLKGV